MLLTSKECLDIQIDKNCVHLFVICWEGMANKTVKGNEKKDSSTSIETAMKNRSKPSEMK